MSLPCRPVAALAGIAALAAVSVAVGTSACSFNWDLQETPREAGPTDDATSSLADADGDADAGSADANADAAPVRPCFSNADCSKLAGQLCVFDHCSATAGGPGGPGPTDVGTCVSAGAGCAGPSPGNAEPLFCGCGNRVFATLCEVVQAGTGLELGCTGVDAGYIPCGYTFCPRQTHFCQVFAESGRYQCTPWGPAVNCAGAVGAQSCPCAVQSCGASGCEDDGGIRVNCPGL